MSDNVQKPEDVEQLYEAGPSDVLEIVNPNPFEEYSDTLSGKNYTFPPLKVWKAERALAYVFVTRAAQLHENRQHAIRGEEETFFECIDNEKAKVRRLAPRFGALIKNENGREIFLPKTKNTMFPGVVCLADLKGKEYFSQGLAMAQNSDPSNTPLLAEKEEMEALEEKAKVPAIPEPNTSWDNKQKIAYIEQYHNKNVFPDWRNQPDMLDKQMSKAYENQCKTLEKLEKVKKG